MPLLYTDKFLYTHMPKTGGTWVSRVIVNSFQDIGGTKVRGRQHGPYVGLPPELKEGRMLVSNVRDPWSWYTSWFQHGMTSENSRAGFRVHGRGTLDFKAILFLITHPEEAKILEKHFGAVWTFAKGEPDYRESFRASGVGLYTWMCRYIYGNPLGVDILLDTAQLTKALGELMGRPIDLAKDPIQNAASHRPTSYIKDPQALWDDEMIQWVWERDREFIDLVGYPGPYEPAPQAVFYAATSFT